jgi:hypothetical protein
MGFIVALTPLSISLMGWRGATGGGAATGYVSTAPTKEDVDHVSQLRINLVRWILTCPRWTPGVLSRQHLPFRRLHGIWRAFLDIRHNLHPFLQRCCRIHGFWRRSNTNPAFPRILRSVLYLLSLLLTHPLMLT